MTQSPCKTPYAVNHDTSWQVDFNKDGMISQEFLLAMGSCGAA
jgi:hypothetical protein